MLSSTLLIRPRTGLAAKRSEEMDDEGALDIPAQWKEAIAALGAAGVRRIAVLGPADAGKTSFIRGLCASWPGVEAPAVLDLDPGQKMVGPPGTAALGHSGGAGGLECSRFVFVGSTSSIEMRRIWAAAARLGAAEPFIANTSGFVLGPGVPLQAGTVAALAADAVVSIGLEAPPLPRGWRGELIRLQPSPLAQRKTAAARARIRQAAFGQHLGLELLRLDRDLALLEPGPPRRWEDERRPVCCLADEAGEDMAIAMLEALDEERLWLRCAAPPRPVRTVRIGKMWAVPAAGGWQLLEKLEPAWEPAS